MLMLGSLPIGVPFVVTSERFAQLRPFFDDLSKEKVDGMWHTNLSSYHLVC